MPVLVTHPETTLARGLIERIAATGGQVRAFGGPETPVAELRQSGVICAVGSLLDEGHLETAMEQVHTVVHLPPLPLVDDPDLCLEQAATVVSAAVGAGVRRLITVSLPEASPAAADPLRRAVAEVEQIVADMPAPSVVVRPSLVDVPEVRDALARVPLAGDVLANRVAPVAAGDLVDLLFTLDERRDELDADHAVLAADGPRVVALRDYLVDVGVTRLGRMVERLRPGSALLAAVLAGPWTSGPDVRSGWIA